MMTQTKKKFVSWRRKSGNVLLTSNVKPRRPIWKLEDDKYKPHTKLIFCIIYDLIMKFTIRGCHWSQEFRVMGQKPYYMVNKAI